MTTDIEVSELVNAKPLKRTRKPKVLKDTPVVSEVESAVLECVEFNVPNENIQTVIPIAIDKHIIIEPVVAPNTDELLTIDNLAVAHPPLKKENIKRSYFIDISEYIKPVKAFNQNESYFWHILALYNDNNRLYVHIGHKVLTETQLDVLEDSRVYNHVMLGQKKSSLDEHWKLLYKQELPDIQKLFSDKNVWISDKRPERKCKAIYTFINSPQIKEISTVIDRDSQIYFLKKSLK